jgi:hypothetical protein
VNNTETVIYSEGFREGFSRGLDCAKHCSNCELIAQCPDSWGKADFCPLSGINKRLEMRVLVSKLDSLSSGK